MAKCIKEELAMNWEKYLKSVTDEDITDWETALKAFTEKGKELGMPLDIIDTLIKALKRD
tara:strand:- start:13 stop:192 length:180 start_codon:yes stop_codon:yes gene_type:complete